MRLGSSRRFRSTVLGLLVPTLAFTGLVTTTTLVTAAPSSAAVPVIATPSALPRAIEPMAAYVPQNSCQPAFRVGTLRLGQMLVRTYPNTSFQGAYNCGTDGGVSEHYDGRAIDWMNSVRNPTQAAQAAAVIKFLLATDKYGNKFAMARRMGIMYIIWNNRIWGSWDGKWDAYNNCANTPATSMDSACHRNHMHFSLSWQGARAKTSFWSKKVAATTDWGPCRAKDLNWAGNYPGYNSKRCPSYPGVGAPAGSSAAEKALVAVSGFKLGYGMSGTPIAALQQAFAVPVTSHYDSRLLTLVKRYQTRHHLKANGVTDGATWRALLKSFAPKK